VPHAGQLGKSTQDTEMAKGIFRSSYGHKSAQRFRVIKMHYAKLLLYATTMGRYVDAYSLILEL
jgi:hypothetical protein